MTVFQTASHSLFHKGSKSLKELMDQTIPQDVIMVNQGSITVDQPVTFHGDVTIEGDPNKKAPVIVINDRMAGFLINSNVQGQIKFKHVALQLGNSSYAIRSMAKNVQVILDDVRVYHTQPTMTPYVSILLDSGGGGSLSIKNSLIDICRADVNNVQVDHSNIGDWYFAGYGESRLYMSQGSITNSAMQNMLVGGHDNMSQAQLSQVALGGNVKFVDLQVAASNLSLMQLPSVNHRSRKAFTNGDSTCLIVGEGCRFNAQHVNQIDPNQQNLQSNYKLPAWRGIGLGGGSLTISDGYLRNGTLKNIAKAGDMTLENVTDDSSWSVTKGVNLSNKNSKSELFAAQSKLAGPRIDGSADGIQNTQTALDKIDRMIGLTDAKKLLRQIIGQAKISAERQKRGLANSSAQRSLNMAFLGNPGTGKTAVAQYVGQALYEAGVLKSTTFKTVTASDLVSNHVGETAMKTRDQFKSAMNGVLFIDEAYELAPPKSGGNSFNNEAVTELVKDMDAYSDRVVVIMAGYTQEMNDLFTRGNPGLASRVNYKIEFKDYTPTELKQIERLFLKDSHARLASPAVMKEMDAGIDKLLSSLSSSARGSGNGRFVRNYVQKITEARDGRLAMQDTSNLSNEQLMIIEPQDVQTAVDAMQDQAELTS